MNPVRWTPAVLFVALLASVVVLVIAPWNPRNDSRPHESAGARSSAAATATIGPTPQASVAELRGASFVGPAYDVNLVAEPSGPTTEARLWFTDGSWWALLVSAATDRITIHELDWASQRWVDTGVPVDTRSFAQTDALWTGTTLYVAGAGPRASAGHALEVSRFGYDAETRRWVLGPDSPQPLTTSGVEQPTLAVDPTGEAWLAYVSNRELFISHTTQNGWTWTIPAPIGAVTDEVERAAIVATDDGVAVAWTGLASDTLGVLRHVAGSVDDAWAAATTTVDGLSYGKDEMSVRSTSDGTILVLLRTSLDAVANRNLDAPQLVLVRLARDEWRSSVVSRVRDGHAGPSLLVDEAHGDVYVLADADGGVYAKRARLDDLSFVTGPGVLVIAPPEPPPAPTPSESTGASAEPLVPELSATTSTRQSLDGLTEIVAVASDDVSGRYAHAVIPLPGGREAPPDAQGNLGAPPDGLVDGLPAGALAYLIRDSFASYPVGPGTAAGWETRTAPGDAVLTIAEPSAGDRSLRLVSAAGDGPRACRSFGNVTSGIVEVSAMVQVRGASAGDAVVTALRSEGQEVAAVRFGAQGTLRYFLGDERITTAVPYRPGTWYHSIVILDLDSQTYRWQLTPLGAQSPILAVNGLSLRVPAPVVDEVCVQVADPTPGAATELYLDDLLVAIGPGS